VATLLLLLLYVALLLLLLLLLVVLMWMPELGGEGLWVSGFLPQLQRPATVSLQQHCCQGLLQAAGRAAQLLPAAAAGCLVPAQTLHLMPLLVVAVLLLYC
jgi:hypothetical protein